MKQKLVISILLSMLVLFGCDNFNDSMMPNSSDEIIAGSIISGVIIDSFNQPITNQTVQLHLGIVDSQEITAASHENTSDSLVCEALTSTDGAFTFTGLQPGTYSLHVVSEDGSVAERSAISISSGEEVVLNTIMLKYTGNIAGKVMLDSQKDHSGIQVLVPGTGYSAVTSTDGAYQFQNVPEGIITLYFVKLGYLPEITIGTVQKDVTSTIAPVVLKQNAFIPTADIISGTQWFLGSCDPADNTIGNDNDYYLNSESFDLFFKKDNNWVKIGNLRGAPGQDGTNGFPGQDGADGLPGQDGAAGLSGQDGADGLPGQDGSTWYVGSDIPNRETGKDNDCFLNNVTYDIYTKQSGVWVFIGNIKGAPGETVTGQTWYCGDIDPDNAFGEEQSFFLNTTTGDIFQKLVGVWRFVTNVTFGAPFDSDILVSPDTLHTKMTIKWDPINTPKAIRYKVYYATEDKEDSYSFVSYTDTCNYTYSVPSYFSDGIYYFRVKPVDQYFQEYGFSKAAQIDIQQQEIAESICQKIRDIQQYLTDGNISEVEAGCDWVLSYISDHPEALFLKAMARLGYLVADSRTKDFVKVLIDWELINELDDLFSTDLAFSQAQDFTANLFQYLIVSNNILMTQIDEAITVDFISDWETALANLDTLINSPTFNYNLPPQYSGVGYNMFIDQNTLRGYSMVLNFLAFMLTNVAAYDYQISDYSDTSFDGILQNNSSFGIITDASMMTKSKNHLLKSIQYFKEILGTSINDYYVDLLDRIGRSLQGETVAFSFSIGNVDVNLASFFDQPIQDIRLYFGEPSDALDSSIQSVFPGFSTHDDWKKFVGSIIPSAKNLPGEGDSFLTAIKMSDPYYYSRYMYGTISTVGQKVYYKLVLNTDEYLRFYRSWGINTRMTIYNAAFQEIDQKIYNFYQNFTAGTYYFKIESLYQTTGSFEIGYYRW